MATLLGGSYVLFILLIIVLIAMSTYISIKLPQWKGAYGEKMVNNKLSKLGTEYKIFHDLYVPNEKGTTQIDHIVTSLYGIFVIETKHYNGWIFGSENQKYWTQVIYKRKEKLFNPIWQNYGHIQSLKTFLNLEDFQHVFSIVAFSNQSTFKFKEDFKSAKVIHFSQLIRTIKEKGQTVLTDKELKDINNTLDRLVLTDKVEKKALKNSHMQQVRQSVKEQKKMKIDVSVCPKCGGTLLMRKGKYGSFYGCNNYPKCKFTKNIN